MKLLFAILLICLVAAGPAAAIAASPASIAAPVKVSPAVQYATMVPVKTTTTQPTIGRALIAPSNLRVTITLVPATASTPVPSTVCLSGQHCLTPEDAALYYKPGWSYKVDEVCGYTGINDTVLKYCTSGTPSPITSQNCLSGEVCMILGEVQGKQVLCGWGGTEYEPLPEYCIKEVTMEPFQPNAIGSMAVNVPVTRVPVTGQTVEPTGTLQPVGQQQGGIVERIVAPLAEPWDEMPAGQQQGGIIESIMSFFGRFFSNPPDPWKGQNQ